MHVESRATALQSPAIASNILHIMINKASKATEKRTYSVSNENGEHQEDQVKPEMLIRGVPVAEYHRIRRKIAKGETSWAREQRAKRIQPRATPGRKPSANHDNTAG